MCTSRHQSGSTDRNEKIWTHMVDLVKNRPVANEVIKSYIVITVPSDILVMTEIDSNT